MTIRTLCAAFALCALAASTVPALAQEETAVGAACLDRTDCRTIVRLSYEDGREEYKLLRFIDQEGRPVFVSLVGGRYAVERYPEGDLAGCWSAEPVQYACAVIAPDDKEWIPVLREHLGSVVALRADLPGLDYPR